MGVLRLGVPNCIETMAQRLALIHRIVRRSGTVSENPALLGLLGGGKGPRYAVGRKIGPVGLRPNRELAMISVGRMVGKQAPRFDAGCVEPTVRLASEGFQLILQRSDIERDDGEQTDRPRRERQTAVVIGNAHQLRDATELFRADRLRRDLDLLSRQGAGDDTGHGGGTSGGQCLIARRSRALATQRHGRRQTGQNPTGASEAEQHAKRKQSRDRVWILCICFSSTAMLNESGYFLPLFCFVLAIAKRRGAEHLGGRDSPDRGTCLPHWNHILS